MPSTPTTRLRFERQALGENLNVWGETKLNDALERIDEAIAGVETIAITGAATVLTSTNYATDQARKAALVLTGTLTANSTVTVPGVQKLYLIVNNTTQGAFTLTIKTAAGSGYALRPGPQHVYCNGADVFRATPTLAEAPLLTAAFNANGQKITSLGTPTAATDAVTKSYVDTATAARAMGGFKITGLGTPTATTDAATKAYVDAGDSATVTAVAGSATNASNAASAASTSASNAATSETNAAASASAAAGSASAASTSASNAATSASAAATSAASIAAGPVSSVNGQTGAVVLGNIVTGLNAGFEVYDAATSTVSNNGRTINFPGPTRMARSNAGRSSGKWYFEFRHDAGSGLMSWGLMTAAQTVAITISNLGQNANGWSLTNTTTDGFYHGSGTAVTTVAGFTPAAGDIVGIAVDFGTGGFWAARNGVWLTGDPASGTSPGLADVSGTVYPAYAGTNTPTETMRLARHEFTYAPPAGFLAWAGESDLPNSSPVLAGTTRVAGRMVSDLVALSANTVDLSAGQYFTRTINGAATFIFSSPPASGAFEFLLELTHTSGAATWPASVTWPAAGAAPTLTAGRTSLFRFITDDGGARWRGFAMLDYTT